MLDPASSVIAGGQISILNTGTGASTIIIKNSSGNFSASNLQPGNYDITLTATGFDEKVLHSVVLTVGETRVLNSTMLLGSVQERVEVSALAPDIDLADATMGGLNDQTSVEQLPLNGRSWTDLIALQLGVFKLETQPGVTTRDRSNRGYGEQFSVSGNRPNGNNYRLDGVSINDPINGGPGSVTGGNLGVDALGEFSVLTGDFTADFGRANGGVLKAITKSGTNQFHGSAYEFVRNSALDARNFFDPGTIPPFERNQFGASAGGPIRKDKTFIFGDYEGLRENLSLSQVSIVPTAAARMGILLPVT